MNQPPDDTLAHFFHSQAAYPLTSISQRGLHSRITEYDVMTALHLVSYSLASVGGKVVNGTTGWGGMADFAIEWLTQTNLHLEDHPKEAMAKMSPSGAFAVRATMVSLRLVSLPTTMRKWMLNITVSSLPHSASTSL